VGKTSLLKCFRGQKEDGQVPVTRQTDGMHLQFPFTLIGYLLNFFTLIRD